MDLLTWSDKIIHFLHHLEIDENILPEGILPLYPMKGDHGSTAEYIIKQFYTKYYCDTRSRRMIIGINPGRLGAGVTGIPFTDTKRLRSHCGIEIEEFSTHEPSSVFIYEMIDAIGKPEDFYRQFYITSVCPVGFVKQKATGKPLNYNYYDSKELTTAIEPYILQKFKEQIEFGVDTSVAYCLGTGKNFKYLKALNASHQLFGQVIPLEHPRYIMQYKNRFKHKYIDKYIKVLSETFN
ncbi:MAG: SMUG2 DNA glycosylase family protein [Bacteroidetes bacterium]|nr:SMUG2 DNA glycosylase family protein [Bacteroidota bacterium]